MAEAISIGTPVVGYNHGGVAEILAAGFPQGAVEFQNLGELTARVRQILFEPNFSMPVINQFEKSTMLERTIELYEAASEQRRYARRN